jgi:HPt (histidine-containing phosphotransfer) domain-containing protein
MSSTATSTNSQEPERATTRTRQVAFLGGLVALLGCAAGYVAVQRPLRESISLEKQLARNVGRIMTLDETLTMSARMAASAHDSAYEARYNEHVDELDRTIKATIGLVPDDGVATAVKSTDAANTRLVDMETKSFELDKAGKYDEALALIEGKQYRADKAIYADGMQRAFTLLEKLTAARTASVERWAILLQLGALLALACVIAAWALEQRERRRQAARYAAELEGKVEQRTAELGQRNRSMRLVLDSVQQGLVGVDHEGVMSPERAAIVDRWFGSVNAPTKFAEYVRSHDPTFSTWFELGLEQLREGTFQLGFCLAQMPKRMRAGERTLAVSYEGILTNGKFDGLLVVMSDITQELQRERSEAEQRDLLRVLEQVGRDRLGFINFLEEASAIVDELVGTAPLPLATTARHLHTLKGSAAQFGLSVVATVCHEIEEHMREGGVLSPEDRNWLDTTWRAVRERIRTVLGDRAGKHLEVEKSEFDNVLTLVQKRQDHVDILQALAAWELDPVQARLERLGDGARTLAARLSKPEPEVICDAHRLRTDNGHWASLWSACVHLVRNAVDHGFEDEAAREAAGKPVRGRMVLSAAVEGNDFVIAIADDGAGIDWDRLGEKARERGLPYETEAQRIAVLFHDGVSSKDEASEVSGRGVGMSAVLSEVERRGGHLSVTSRRGHGTTVQMRFPAHTMMGLRRKDATDRATA